LHHKVGLKASATAVIRLDNSRVPKENLLASLAVDTENGYAGVIVTFDNTLPLVAAIAVAVERAALAVPARILDPAGIDIDYDAPANTQHAAAAECLRLEAEFEAA